MASRHLTPLTKTVLGRTILLTLGSFAVSTAFQLSVVLYVFARWGGDVEVAKLRYAQSRPDRLIIDYLGACAYIAGIPYKCFTTCLVQLWGLVELGISRVGGWRT